MKKSGTCRFSWVISPPYTGSTCLKPCFQLQHLPSSFRSWTLLPLQRAYSTFTFSLMFNQTILSKGLSCEGFRPQALLGQTKVCPYAHLQKRVTGHLLELAEESHYTMSAKGLAGSWTLEAPVNGGCSG